MTPQYHWLRPAHLLMLAKRYAFFAIIGGVLTIPFVLFPMGSVSFIGGLITGVVCSALAHWAISKPSLLRLLKVLPHPV